MSQPRPVKGRARRLACLLLVLAIGACACPANSDRCVRGAYLGGQAGVGLR